MATDKDKEAKKRALQASSYDLAAEAIVDKTLDLNAAMDAYLLEEPVTNDLSWTFDDVLNSNTTLAQIVVENGSHMPWGGIQFDNVTGLPGGVFVAQNGIPVCYLDLNEKKELNDNKLKVKFRKRAFIVVFDDHKVLKQVNMFLRDTAWGRFSI